MSTENQYHDQAPGWFSTIVGNRDTATAVWDEALGIVRRTHWEIQSDELLDEKPLLFVAHICCWI
jgi:hypothetical protein